VKGLVVVEVSGGKLATHAESKKLVEARDPGHAVLWDQDNRNHESYGIQSWPSAYLIGADGKVFWQGNPARMQNRPEEAERFRKLLINQLDLARPREGSESRR